ncbi:3-oxoacyl-reductase [Echria macrotheca]|uniref:3-oxoacyl-reductase n=1 Tax=Echria macrotheca TaxID=438768 RepID=A0AAJ0BT32_9PEZI|nr:3-oxoacyl-reductase [Echria macrotheca]
MSTLVWLVTGCTSGAGLGLVKAIAARGDKVIATGRNASTRLADLKSDSIAVVDLDITQPLDEIKQIVSDAVAIFGRIDVLVNNAGMSRLSTLEEASEALLKKLFEVNLFGAIKATQAVLPHMRAAKKGTIVFIGAGLGWVSLPFFMFAEGLNNEISPQGLRSIIFEPGGFDSNLASSRDKDDPFAHMPQVPEYGELFARTLGRGAGVPPKMSGDINKLPDAIIDVIRGEGLAKGRPFPVRVALGPDSLDVIRQKCNEQLSLLDEWEDVSLSVMAEGKRETSRWLLDGSSILNKSGQPPTKL